MSWNCEMCRFPLGKFGFITSNFHKMREEITLDRSVLSYNSLIEKKYKTSDSVLSTQTNILWGQRCHAKVVHTERCSLLLIILFWFVYFLSLWSEQSTSNVSFESPRRLKVFKMIPSVVSLEALILSLKNVFSWCEVAEIQSLKVSCCGDPSHQMNLSSK